MEVACHDSVHPLEASTWRSHARHSIPVTMLLEVFSENGEVNHSENTVTENISRKGATFYSSLDVPAGRFIRLTSTDYNLGVHAVVRDRSKGSTGMPRLHVEFMD